jgi:hypothetical protein
MLNIMLFVCLFFETGLPYLAQTSLEFTMQPRLASNPCSFCLSILSARIIGMHYHISSVTSLISRSSTWSLFLVFFPHSFSSFLMPLIILYISFFKLYFWLFSYYFKVWGLYCFFYLLTLSHEEMMWGSNSRKINSLSGLTLPHPFGLAAHTLVLSPPWQGVCWGQDWWAKYYYGLNVCSLKSYLLKPNPRMMD